MIDLPLCPRCGKEISINQQIIKYHAGSRPIYEQFCKPCVGDMWKYMYREYINHPHFLDFFKEVSDE
jgi:hypothetical protein